MCYGHRREKFFNSKLFIDGIKENVFSKWQSNSVRGNRVYRFYLILTASLIQRKSLNELHGHYAECLVFIKGSKKVLK